MSYLVLARKYRPQTFADVVGQEHVTRTLANAFAQGRVHHGFLFCGPRGVGKTTLARILGRALNCEKGPSAEPCGTCDPCTTIAAGNAVDYIEMDGASNRGIDSIRDLTEAVRYQPAAMRKKVYVIDEVHMLTTEAFNALLKTLEEPPPHVTFVLATTEPHKVPVTILSRCQRYDFKLVPASRLAAHLGQIFGKEGIEVDAGAIEVLVRESGGSVRDALSLSDQVISYVGGEAIREAQVAEVLGVADRALTRSLIESVAAGDAAAALDAVESAVTRGLDEVQLTRALTRALHDIAVAQAGPGAAGHGSDAERAELARLAGELEPTRVRLMCDRMLRACIDLAESPEPRIVLDLALIDLAALEPPPPITTLLDRLGDLERRLGSGAPAARPSAPSRAPRASAGPAPAVAPEPPRVASPAPVAAPEPPKAEAAGEAPLSSASASALERWEFVIQGLEEARELSLVSIYQHARILGWTETAIEVGFAPGMAGEMASEADKVAAMRLFLGQRLGRQVSFTVRTIDQGAADSARSIIEAEADRRREETSKRQDEAREHPLTKVVLDTFGASIKEIKTDV
jgi:DNA polymerase-3 subunit gamma/tau